MSKYDDSFDIDDILAEFTSYSDSIAGEAHPARKEPSREDLRTAPEYYEEEYGEAGHGESEYDEPAYDEPIYDEPVHDEPVYKKPKKPGREKAAYAKPRRHEPVYDEPEYGDESVPERPRRKPAAKPKTRRKEAPELYDEYGRSSYSYDARAAERRRTAAGPLRGVVTVLFVFITLLTFVWISKNVHPDSGTVTAAAVQNNTNLVSRLDMYVNNAKSEALGDLAYIRKLYTIPETDTVAPKPNAAAFGKTDDMSVIQSVIDDAAELLDGQELVWSPDLDFYPDNYVYYYRDATILALVWRERINNRSATVAEIKIADGSQIRRKLSEDTYGSSVQSYASKLAESANAVVAMNADFYGFRQIGVTVYQRQLFRFSPDRLDNCFINSKGDMLFMKAGSIADEAQMYQYIADNDVLYSLSFGPILVDNGELQYCSSYPIGEIDREYSRAGLGMVDELHYVYMTVNHCNGQNPRCNVNEFAEIMYSKGCYKAYNLDGGQTSEIVFNGQPVNYIDFGAERTVTDIIYFATALPESEVSQ